MNTKVTKKHFAVFVKECKRCVQRLGLQSYSMVYTHERLDNALAQAHIEYDVGLAKIALGKTWDGVPVTVAHLKATARHEIAHVLIGRLAYCALSRFTSNAAIYEAGEEIANRLEEIL